VIRPTLLVCLVALALPTLVAGPNAAAVRGRFDGIWNSATATPLERPLRLKDKAFFTPEEAAAWERQTAEDNEEPSSPAASTNRGTGTYNTVYREYGSRVVKTRRTSIVTDPPDGRIPALTPAAAEVKRRRVEAMKIGANAEDLGLQDQCLAFVTAGPPMLPYSYNSNYQIFQTSDAVVIHAEMMHDARIIPLDGRAHLPPTVRRWAVDSIGRWSGDTLVVDTTNFTDKTRFRNSTQNLHVVERFSRLDRNNLLYRFTIEDPHTWTRPWTGEMAWPATSERIYEYACHEGNYALGDILRGARLREAEAAKTKEK